MDMSQYLDMFLEESYENLQNLNEDILGLEKNPEDKDLINAIFRAAHTLKGMAGSMGFSDIAELTHKMENVLDKFRNDELKVTSEVITILFRCLDTLEKMISNIQNGSNEIVDINEIMLQLQSIVDSKNSDKHVEKKNLDDFKLNEYDINIVKQAYEKGYKVYKVDVELIKDCVLKSARAFLVYKTLESIGEIVKSSPSIEDIEQEKFDLTFSIVVISDKQKETIEGMVLAISEIKKVNVDLIENVKNEIKENEDKKDQTAVEKAAAENIKNSKEDEKNTKKTHQSVRVDIERLDKFMNLVGELVIHRTRLEQISNNHRLNDLHETLEQVGRITTDLQDLVMKVRMLPIERVFNRFPRMVRDLAQELNKDIEFIIEGEETELDRTVIDEIGEPLVHLIRNAVDHGIEPVEERIKKGKNPKGVVKLTAYQEGNKAVIRIDDDGNGFNLDKIKKKAQSLGIDTEGMSNNDIKNLIFLQGFSTSDKVTDISGRGVGMDVVKTKIASLGGTIDVVSEFGKGSSFIIRLPLTLSIIQALLVKVGSETLAISLGFIDRVINVNINEIKLTNNKEVIMYRGSIIPVVRLADRLNLVESDNSEKYVVIVKVGEKTVGLIVDSLFGQQEIVIKSMGKTLQSLKEYVGATILGDGLVTLIVDVAALV
ncbi:chemotaxis protein CheA [Fervidicella metallireducens AeB]|uniref:Chemotaxis protein CheA n=1 Tax=Fervidicella metallireducens AeB TaxID=1403537 RepID=A0A017RXU9_9CLOT|nr:chemotaxis protein CheA [Fervidicella metallireducens]EYE88770.1 chemotaxis protein CheA [Fervidicella metallireducens AeB]